VKNAMLAAIAGVSLSKARVTSEFCVIRRAGKSVKQNRQKRREKRKKTEGKQDSIAGR